MIELVNGFLLGYGFCILINLIFKRIEIAKFQKHRETVIAREYESLHCDLAGPFDEREISVIWGWHLKRFLKFMDEK